MNNLIIDLNALDHNFQNVNQWVKQHGSSWTLVTKVLCGHKESLQALQQIGVQSMGDSRLFNFRVIEKIVPDFEAWYLRIPDLSSIEEVISLTDVSLNSEITVIEALNQEAKKQDKIHRIIIMIEMGDLREGILPSSLTRFYDIVFRLSNIEVIGIGANFACMSGTAPDVEKVNQLILYRDMLQLKFGKELPLISAGATVMLPMLIEKQLPSEINHFRIGEAVFLGTDLINGGTLLNLRDDAFILEAEIAEMKRKSMTPSNENSAQTPFDTNFNNDALPDEHGYRAILTVGQLDTDVAGLYPLNADYTIVGASSDLMVVNLGENVKGLTIGDKMRFKLSYSALLRLMHNNYLDKVVIPNMAKFINKYENNEVQVPPVFHQMENQERSG